MTRRARPKLEDELREIAAATAPLGAERRGAPDAPGRGAAAGAPSHSRDDAHAALLLLKLRCGDAEADVSLACMTGLLVLAPGQAVPRLAAMLAADPTGPSGALAA